MVICIFSKSFDNFSPPWHLGWEKILPIKHWEVGNNIHYVHNKGKEGTKQFLWKSLGESQKEEVEEEGTGAIPSKEDAFTFVTAINTMWAQDMKAKDKRWRS